MEQPNRARGFLLAVVWFLVFVLLLLGAAGWVAFDRSHYLQQYRKLGTAAQVGMSEEALMRVTGVWMEYLIGARDTLDTQETVSGAPREVFTAQEKAHMVDVKNLFTWGIRLAAASLVLAAGLFAFCALRWRRGLAKALSRSFFRALIAFGALFALIALAFAIDFNWAFTWFHRIFFRNDLWLLDPAESLMIQMVPEPFFMSCVTRLLVAVAAVLAALCAAMAYLGRRGRHGVR